MNIKVGRVGGFSEAKKVHEFIRDNNVPVWCGGGTSNQAWPRPIISLYRTLLGLGTSQPQNATGKKTSSNPKSKVSAQGTIAVSNKNLKENLELREDLIEKLTARCETITAESA